MVTIKQPAPTDRFRQWLWVFPIAVLGLSWEVVSQAGLVNASLVPPPTAIVRALVQGFSPGQQGGFPLLRHTVVSLGRLGLGVGVALSAGAALGFLMGMSRPLRSFLRPLLSIFMPVPAIVWTPILMLFLGLGTRTIVATVVLGAIFPVAYNTLLGVQRIPKQQLWVIRSMGGGAWAEFSKVLLPGALPSVVAGLETGVAYGWRALVAAEMIAATGSGLGYSIFYAREYMLSDQIYAGIVLIALTGLAIERLGLRTVERATVDRWGVRLR